MKIAITQRQVNINGIIYDCLEQGWYNLFKDHELCIIPNMVNVVVDADMLVLSGGDESPQRYKTELTVCDWAMRHGKPILGVCHGAFFLNYAFGGINAEIDGHRETDHKINMEGQQFIVNSYHDVCIYELGAGLVSLADDGKHCEAFTHKDYPIWGVVWHPERMENLILPSELRNLING